MIKPEMIPVEASLAILKAWNGCECEVCCAVAIAAALNAWPDMEEHITWPEEKLNHIILPMEAGE